MRIPDFFIVGAPKCGTTALYHYLKQHPEIFMPEVKEILFFGSDLGTMMTKGEYISYFTNVTSEKRVGTAHVWYLYSKLAACEIKQFSPSADIIIMLRNPVDMIYSLHSQLVYEAVEDINDFGAALCVEEQRKEGKLIPKNTKKESLVEYLFYREAGKYTTHLQRYFDVFGREKVQVIIYDDFKSNTGAVYKKTLEFLNVDSGFTPEFRIFNLNKRPRSKILQSFFFHPPALLRMAARTVLPRKIRKLMIAINTKYETRKPMDPELRLRLQEEFAQEVECLSKLLDRDLTHWLHSKSKKAHELEFMEL